MPEVCMIRFIKKHQEAYAGGHDLHAFVPGILEIQKTPNLAVSSDGVAWRPDAVHYHA